MKYDNVVTITGVSGFVGSHLARALLENNDEGGPCTRVFGCDVGLSDRIADLVDSPHFRFFDYNVHQPLRSDLLAVDSIYHFAGIADPAVYLERPIDVMDLNLMGLKNILERIVFWSGHRPRIVYSSTSEVYGLNEEVPFHESLSHMVFGQHKRWCYALSKAVGEQYLRAYSEKHGIRHTIFRFFNFVGDDIDAPGQGRVLTKMVADALDNNCIRVTSPGTQTRCFTHVDDFVVPLVRASTMKIFQRPKWDNDYTINLGSDEEVSMNELAGKIWKILHDEKLILSNCIIKTVGRDVMYGQGYDDAMRRRPDVTRAENVLEWRAERRLDDFLPELVRGIARRHIRERATRAPGSKGPQLVPPGGGL
jgi:nucleoside-diphosphate-sugar epimerase